MLASTQRAASPLISSGSLEVRLAENFQEVDEATRLRFEVFNLELNEGLLSSWDRGYDSDPYDACLSLSVFVCLSLSVFVCVLVVSSCALCVCFVCCVLFVFSLCSLCGLCVFVCSFCVLCVGLCALCVVCVLCALCLCVLSLLVFLLSFSHSGEDMILVFRLSYRDWETDRKSTRLNSSH